MIVLHPNTEQYNALDGYRNGNALLKFVKDGSDRWIVGTNVLNDPNFSEINDQLEQLERIEYTPFPPIDDETN
jgi:hypothetical protein